MLNTFPDLLTLGFFAPTLLRLAVAIIFLLGAFFQYTQLEELSHLRFPIVGGGARIIWLSIIAHTVVGAMLLAGYYTQIAAIFGALAAIKGLIYAHRYPKLFSLDRPSYFLILVICLSLLLSGAGAFAFDLPL